MSDKDTLVHATFPRAGVLPHVVVVQCAMLSALAIVLGHTLAVVPNVEMVTLVVFIAGMHAGSTGGMVTALTTTVYFNYLNPMGQVLLPVLMGQFIGWSLASQIGAWFARRPVRSRMDWALVGAVATVTYQVAVNATYVWLCCPGASWTERGAVIVAGLSFSLVHVLSNIVVFGILGEPLVRVVRRN